MPRRSGPAAGSRPSCATMTASWTRAWTGYSPPCAQRSPRWAGRSPSTEATCPAYANGQRFVKRGGELRKRFADPDATSGHRSSISTRSGGDYYGYKVHAAVCTTMGLPVAWKVETAKDSELPLVPVLLDAVARRGFTSDV